MFEHSPNPLLFSVLSLFCSHLLSALLFLFSVVFCSLADVFLFSRPRLLCFIFQTLLSGPGSSCGKRMTCVRYPNLSVMARQYPGCRGCPVTSASVELLFYSDSAVGAAAFEKKPLGSVMMQLMLPPLRRSHSRKAESSLGLHPEASAGEWFRPLALSVHSVLYVYMCACVRRSCVRPCVLVLCSC